jgi:hypothetical protein
MPHTADTCTSGGEYVGSCADRVQISMDNGDTFPPCPSCNKGVDWTKV